VKAIVLHVLGGPVYRVPAERFRFRSPLDTMGRWKAAFGAHWIVDEEGSVWPRTVQAGEARWFRPELEPAEAVRARVARVASPVLAHCRGSNRRSVGIEVAHSGRSGDPFPRAQVRSVAWLVRTLLELSEGRLGAGDVYGHKDLDRRPAYVSDRCIRAGCAVYVDAQGRPYRRRVDPPEALFEALAAEGLAIPRAGREDDRELLRAEALGAAPAREAR
jgi:N-acetyl-anhydromuramyl-L-alanine amidase AmpD